MARFSFSLLSNEFVSNFPPFLSSHDSSIPLRRRFFTHVFVALSFFAFRGQPAFPSASLLLRPDALDLLPWNVGAPFPQQICASSWSGRTFIQFFFCSGKLAKVAPLPPNIEIISLLQARNSSPTSPSFLCRAPFSEMRRSPRVSWLI